MAARTADPEEQVGSGAAAGAAICIAYVSQLASLAATALLHVTVWPCCALRYACCCTGRVHADVL
jgi:hypothetical protein